MGLRLFVDDIRACPTGWIPARTVTEAIRILATQDVFEISLDHDIQCQPTHEGAFHSAHCSPETFEPVARFLDVLETAFGVGIDVQIHTSNFDAGKKMADILKIEYTPYIYNQADYDEKTMWEE